MFNFFCNAKATISGSNKYSKINGTFWFRKIKDGVLVTAKVYNLPTSKQICQNKIFAVHIHQNGNCSGTIADPFSNVGTHYNPDNCIHPNHAGDLEPLFENNGYAYYSFITNRFSIDEIIGRSVIIHDDPDDFTTQPSGNSGNKIACGVIKKC